METKINNSNVNSKKANSKTIPKKISIKDINPETIKTIGITPYLPTVSKDKFISIGIGSVIVYDEKRGTAWKSAVMTEWFYAFVFLAGYLHIEFHVNKETGKIEDFSLSDYDTFEQNNIMGMVRRLSNLNYAPARKALRDFELFKSLFEKQLDAEISRHNEIIRMQHIEIMTGNIIGKNEISLLKVVNIIADSLKKIGDDAMTALGNAIESNALTEEQADNE